MKGKRKNGKGRQHDKCMDSFELAANRRERSVKRSRKNNRQEQDDYFVEYEEFLSNQERT